MTNPFDILPLNLFNLFSSQGYISLQQHYMAILLRIYTLAEFNRFGLVREVVIAFSALGKDCQQLLRLLATEPPLSYEEISEITGRPVGSLGPTRARCIARLKSAMGISKGQAGSIDQGDGAK